MLADSSRASLIGLLAILAAASPAFATKYTYVITGTTVAPTSDPFGVYGYPGTILPTGEMFTLTYVVDDALPTAIYSYGASGSSANGGGMYASGTTPPVTASLAIGGDLFTVRTGDAYTPAPVTDSGDPDGAEITDTDLGSVQKSGTTLSLGAKFDETILDYVVVELASYSQDDDWLAIDLSSPELTSPDYRQVGTFALSPDSVGLFVTSYLYDFRDEYIYADYTAAGLSASSLTVTSDAATAVPEPASWGLMLAGFGAAGFALRRRQALRTSFASASSRPLTKPVSRLS